MRSLEFVFKIQTKKKVGSRLKRKPIIMNSSTPEAATQQCSVNPASTQASLYSEFIWKPKEIELSLSSLR